jgi:hypothetical protein
MEVKDPYKKGDPTAFALWRQNIERVGRERGCETIPCPCCGKFLWTESGKILAGSLPLAETEELEAAHIRRNPTLGVPLDMHTDYCEAVTKLGKKQGYETARCPHCDKLLWTTGEIVPARLH